MNESTSPLKLGCHKIVVPSEPASVHTSFEGGRADSPAVTRTTKVVPLSPSGMHDLEGGRGDKSGDMTGIDHDGGQKYEIPNGEKTKPSRRSIPLPASKAVNSNDPNAPKFPSNYISTTKYTLLSFLPLGLLYQFFRFSNCYFLFVTILQCIPAVSPLNPVTAILPMIFVLTISMLREGYEDYQRYASDEGKFFSFIN